MPDNGRWSHGTTEDTGEIPAVGIPAKYQKECPWGDTPIYACDHCRQNGTFDPRRYNFLSASELQPPRSGVGATSAPSNRTYGTEPGMTDRDGKYIRSEGVKISGSFLSDLEVRRILEGMGVELNRNPVDEAFQRNRFRRGQGRF